MIIKTIPIPNAQYRFVAVDNTINGTNIAINESTVVTIDASKFAREGRYNPDTKSYAFDADKLEALMTRVKTKTYHIGPNVYDAIVTLLSVPAIANHSVTASKIIKSFLFCEYFVADRLRDAVKAELNKAKVEYPKLNNDVVYEKKYKIEKYPHDDFFDNYGYDPDVDVVEYDNGNIPEIKLDDQSRAEKKFPILKHYIAAISLREKLYDMSYFQACHRLACDIKSRSYVVRGGDDWRKVIFALKTAKYEK